MATVFQQVLDRENRANPWPLYAELRRNRVVREPDDRYVVSRYRDIVALLHDPRVSSHVPEEFGGPAAEAARSFINLDPPDHDRVRRILNRHYGPPETPGRIDGMRPELLEIVTELIDRMVGRAEIDVVDDLAYPFPVTVICRLLGVPVEDEPRFHVWADTIVEGVGPTGAVSGEARAERERAFAELGAYLGELADARCDLPGEDLMSALVTDDGELGRIPHAELERNLALLLVAGHETTVNLIANGMLTLLRNPDVLARIRQDPLYAIPTVEELLRYEPPVQLLPNRVALADIDIAGTTIPAGSQITLVLAAGNRDPDHVRDPDRFDPRRFDPEGPTADRESAQHLGFGGGVHHCFGAPLARQEAQIALVELARRLDNPRLLADPPPYRPNAVLRGPRHLPIAVDRVNPEDIPRARRPAEHPAATRESR
ncbi:cytochrome P450 [Saccharopolyspora rosea]|uniref:Cytochrome P450 n=1 Tax=Saccharopolyspora rosea TaxID=524884 RepID=A0ABW3FUJ8_9PSEU|nr:cytochrome P450 [Saccharopolyspora rosea]